MATVKFPRRNLPPDSEIWGRDIESRIQRLENRQDQGLQNGNVNRTLNLVSQQIESVVETQEALAAQQVILAQTQDAQRLAIVTNSGVVGPIATNTTTPTTRISLSLSVPTGSTSALVLGAVALTASKTGSATNDNYIEQRVVLTDSSGSTLQPLPSVLLTTGIAVGVAGRTGGTYSFFTAGLSTGTLNLDFQTYASFSTFGVNASLDVYATAIFFRSPVN